MFLLIGENEQEALNSALAPYFAASYLCINTLWCGEFPRYLNVQ